MRGRVFRLNSDKPRSTTLGMFACALALVGVAEVAALTASPAQWPYQAPVSASPAENGQICPPRLLFDVDSPTWSRSVEGNAIASRWMASDGRGQQAPIAAVRGRLDRIRVAPRSPRLPGAASVSGMLRGQGAVAGINGDFFTGLGEQRMLPHGLVMTDGRVQFAPPGWTRVVAIDHEDRLRTTRVRLDAHAFLGGKHVIVESMNSPVARGKHASLFSTDWRGDLPPMPLASTVVVTHGKVTSIRPPGHRVRLPAGSWALRLRLGADIDDVRRGDRVRLAARVVSRDGESVVSASGHGGVILKGRRVVNLCSEYENLARPRSLLAWDDSGTVWFLAAGTLEPDDPDGVRLGGATKSQLAAFAKGLGATHAVALDGGGSTTLAINVSGAVRRLDAQDDVWSRRVPNVWIMQTRT
jgi:hypothetical protein